MSPLPVVRGVCNPDRRPCSQVDALRKRLDAARAPGRGSIRFARDRDEETIAVHRGNLWPSTVTALTDVARTGSFLRRFQISFIGEDGSDYGGLRREWFHLVTLEMVKPEVGIFEISPGNPYEYQLSPHDRYPRARLFASWPSACLLRCGASTRRSHELG